MTVEDKIRDVLASLATLSEAPTSSLEPQTSHGSSDGHVPPGVAERANLLLAGRNHPPKKDESLYEWWRWRFGKALAEGSSEFDLYRLCLFAERDYATRRFPSPDRMALRSGTLDDRDAVDGGAAERAAAERVIDFYEGVPAVEVAVHEYTSEAWVKKARRMHGRDAADGRARPEFLDWDDPERHRQVAKLEAKGMGQKAAADRLRVAKSTVQRYWPEPVAAAA